MTTTSDRLATAFDQLLWYALYKLTPPSDVVCNAKAVLAAHAQAQDGDAKDAARWRAFRRSTGHECDLSTGPNGKPKDILVRLDATGVVRWNADGSLDYEATLDSLMDDEIRLQSAPPPQQEAQS